MAVTTTTKAEYFKQRLEENQGNPLIEAIPPRLRASELVLAVARLPGFHAEQRDWKDYERELLIKRLEKCVIPLSIYQDVYATIYTTLVSGYQDRNPISAATNKWLYAVARNVQVESKTSADSILVTGLSGAGKSTLINSVLSCFPQIIEHQSFGGRPFKQKQLVYLKFDMPPDASRKALCMGFFCKVDEAVGTNYGKQYQKKGVSIDDMERAIRTICASHCIGIIIIDEFENLSIAKAGGKNIILGFFNSITNQAKVPVVKVGTTEALSLFGEKFKSARRAGSGGLFELGQLDRNGSDWKQLVTAIWRYQWIRKPTDLSEMLEESLYNLTQGVPFCLFKLMQLANLEAISSGTEKISKSLLERVYQKHFGLMRHAISALRTGRGKRYEDLLSVSSWLEGHGTSFPKAHLANLVRSSDFKGAPAKELLHHIDDELAESNSAGSERRDLKRLRDELATSIAEGDGEQFLETAAI
jgi:energy-coupling factor transporter ATP-binding protein EcfA2